MPGKKVEFLFVVTKPTGISVMDDICFAVQLPWGLYHQFRGGLDPAMVHGFYSDQGAAEKEARRLLEVRDAD